MEHPQDPRELSHRRRSQIHGTSAPFFPGRLKVRLGYSMMFATEWA
jgi:hypothetical protein